MLYTRLGYFLLTSILTLSSLSLSLSASAKLNVFACEPEWQALTQALGGARVEVYSATTAFQDPHYIEARPSLIAKTRQADLLVCTGADLEIGWLPLLLRQSGNAIIQTNEPGYFLAADQVETIDKPTLLDRSQGDVHAQGNPHVHWDPARLLTIAQQLSKRLQTIDPDHAPYYQQQLIAFESRWTTAMDRWNQQRQAFQGMQVIVNHKFFNYLLNWLQVEVAGDLEPKPGIPPTSAHLATLLQNTRNAQPQAILLTNYQQTKGAQWLSDKSGVPIVQLPFTIGGAKATDDLVALYDVVINQLLQHAPQHKSSNPN